MIEDCCPAWFIAHNQFAVYAYSNALFYNMFLETFHVFQYKLTGKKCCCRWINITYVSFKVMTAKVANEALCFLICHNEIL